MDVARMQVTRQHFYALSGTARLLTIVCLSFVALASSAWSQAIPDDVPPVKGRYTPHHHTFPPGRNGEWAAAAKPLNEGYFQPVSIELPSKGSVTFYAPGDPRPIDATAPASAGMLVGRVYRFRIAGMPEYPGVELYPSVEILNRLHPPAGQEQDFPIPVHITAEEIETVLTDQMVNKVIYLETPQIAAPIPQPDQGIITYQLPGNRNLMEAAYQRGRPMVILRLGGRQPDPTNPEDDLFRLSSPLKLLPKPTTKTPAANQ